MHNPKLSVALVRLCECDGNVQKRVSRHGSLTDLGRQQALATRHRLRDLEIRSVFAPDNSACRETAAILSDGVPVELANEFKEPPYPKWAGLTLGQVQEEWPNEWRRYWNPRPGDAGRVVVPDGESLQVTFDRAKAGLDRLYAQHAGSTGIAIVTHGEVIRVLTVGLLGAPLEHLFHLRGRNGALSIFEFDAELATFECINDTAHLVGLAPKDLVDYMAKT